MPLKKNEIEKFKKILENMRRNIMMNIKDSSDEVKSNDDHSGYSQHQADQGTDDFDRSVTLEVTSKEYHVLKLINRALEKIEENTYGICDVTGEEIPVARLEAIPYATMTVKAQDKIEKGLL